MRFTPKTVFSALVAIGLFAPIAGAEPVSMENPALLRAIGQADILVLGEVHDNPYHHQVQAAAMGHAFAQDKGEPAVVFEMIPQSLQDSVDRYSGSWDGFADAVSWQDRGWPDPALYAPIFQKSFEAEAEIRGGDIDRPLIGRLYSEGAEALPYETRQVFNLLEPLAPEVAEEMADIQFESHCGLMPRSRTAPMVTIQRARDAALARAVLEAFREGFRPVVLITGNGHARDDFGVPALLRRALPETEIVSLGALEAGWEEAPFTFYTITDAVERPDPCEALKQNMEGTKTVN